jgi:hypothetical protein
MRIGVSYKETAGREAEIESRRKGELYVEAGRKKELQYM